MYRRNRSFISRMRVGLGLLACACAMVACNRQQAAEESEMTVDVTIGMHEPASVKNKAFSVAFDTAGVLPYTYQDITSIRLDVSKTTPQENLFTNIWMEQSGTEWIATLPHVPLNTELDFIATAYDADNVAIFRGNTLRTFLGGDTGELLTIALGPIDDGGTYDLPRIVSIRYPETFVSRQDSIVTFTVEGPAGATFSYEITKADGTAAPFYPASGQITLAGTVGQFVSTYRAPVIDTLSELDYHVTVAGDGSARVRTEFTATVEPSTGAGSQDLRFQFLYNPVINEMIASRTPGTNDVVWEAVVSDDGDPLDLVYQWSFVPGETFSPAPSLTDSGTTNPVTLQDYSVAVYGTMQLDVTDANGGKTTLFYDVVTSQFPDQPIDPGADTALRSIESGQHHTCALFNDGGVRCWGRNDDGQLGYGHTDTIGDGELPSAEANVPLPAGDPAVQLATGSSHTCVLLRSGAVQCWGSNEYGQLGYGHTNNIGDDEAINGSLGGNIDLDGIAVAVTAGAEHTCALLDTGTVQCWGYNNNGQLGYGHTDNIGDDEAVWTVDTVDLNSTALDIAAGYWHTCALLDTGTVQCWGYNNHGELGTGNTTYIGDDEVPSSVSPVNVGGTVVQIAAGRYHTCALLDTGAMRCWGYGYYGRLGYGNTATLSSPGGDIDVGATVTQIALGENHTCALLSTSQVKCWGYGYYGQLGTGNSGGFYIGDDEVPSSVSPVSMGGSSPFQVTGGGHHTCALLSTGNARCWGLNNYGQLGYGNTSNLSTPGGDIELIAP